jgi:hypothetical protein
LHVPRKSLADLKQQPRHVTADELLGVFAARGWTVRAGTRHGSIVEKAGHTHLVPRPHGKHLLPVYVQRAIRLIEEVK